jgi:hypothetical protein
LSTRVPRVFLQALVLTRERYPLIFSRLRCYIFSSDVEVLSRDVSELGLLSTFTFCPRVGRCEVIALQKGADALLFVDWNGVEDDGMTSAKVFEYLAAGVRILSVEGRRDSAANKVLSDSPLSTVCGQDVEAACAALQSLCLVDGGGARLPESVVKFSRRRLAEQLLDAVRLRLPAPRENRHSI